jgi:type VI secretion system protein ImpJ
MAKRPVHWNEGMFLKPHHFQAAERYARERLRESEDWLHPHNWGLRRVRFDPDALKNFSAVVVECQARLKDGTTVSIPEELTVDPLDLRPAFEGRGDTMLMLAVPSWRQDRANVERPGDETGARFVLGELDCPDENTGGDEEPIEFRNLRGRLLSSHLDVSGFERLPLARIRRGAGADAPPEIDPGYIPPLLGVDAWAPLQEDLERFFQQLKAVVRQESDYLVGRKIAFDSQVLGDAERILKLSRCNAAYSHLQAILTTPGLHPFGIYGELCRLVGDLSLFDDKRRPIDLPVYDHDDLGPRYAAVLSELRRLLGLGPKVQVEKRYFQVEGREFQVRLEPTWTPDAAKLYIGIESAELDESETDLLLRKTDWKLGSAEEISDIFKNAKPGLGMTPLARIPPALPRDVVYFEIVRRPEAWKDVLRTYTLALRFPTERIRYKSPRIFALTSPASGRQVDLQFAVYVVKAS